MTTLRWGAGRSIVLAAPLAMAGALTAGLGGPAPSAAASPTTAAATCLSAVGRAQPPSPSKTVNKLLGVTMLSPCDVWTVGFAVDGNRIDQPLAEHWDGTTWTELSPQSAGTVGSHLKSVAGVKSPTGFDSHNVWAVGDATSDEQQTLIVHWDGDSWTRIPSPSPANTFSSLNGVTSVSADEAWAVGQSFSNDTGFRVLIEHWDKLAWHLVTIPNPGGATTGNVLNAVTATSRNDVWAVGRSTTSKGDKPLILHFDGKRWKQVHTPFAPGFQLWGVAASTHANAWAVGSNSAMTKTIALHWDGKKWSRVATPNPGGSAQLRGVAVTSAKHAWAVGSTPAGPLFLFWDGKKWRAATVTGMTDGADFTAVAARSVDVWAVGDFFAGGVTQALAVNCPLCVKSA